MDCQRAGDRGLRGWGVAVLPGEGGSRAVGGVGRGVEGAERGARGWEGGVGAGCAGARVFGCRGVCEFEASAGGGVCDARVDGFVAASLRWGGGAGFSLLHVVTNELGWGCLSSTI